MNVNTRQHGSGGGEKKLVRHEELDQELGGITYRWNTVICTVRITRFLCRQDFQCLRLKVRKL